MCEPEGLDENVGDGTVDAMVCIDGEDVFWFFPWEYGNKSKEKQYQLCFEVLWWWLECN